ncbi:MAG: hypothetical protein J7M13_01385 [Synergistetes bacterium]|nr:hypothetical protein [Synergistota bacterium]
MSSILKDFKGVILIVGGVDVGKTTFTLFLANKFLSEGRSVAIVDADPGQSDIGPPGTLSVGFLERRVERMSEIPPAKLAFIGSTSPGGIFTWPTIWGLNDLVLYALSRSDVVIIDSSGLVKGKDGYILIRGKISLIKPDLVIFLGKEGEYLHLVQDARRYSKVKVIPSPPGVKKKSQEERRMNRARRWKEYFSDSIDIDLAWDSLEIGGFPRFGVGVPLSRRSLNELSLELGVKVIWAESEDGNLRCLLSDHPESDIKPEMEWLTLGAIKGTLVGLEGMDDLLDVGMVIDLNEERIIVKTPYSNPGNIRRLLISRLRIDKEVLGA